MSPKTKSCFVVSEPHSGILWPSSYPALNHLGGYNSTGTRVPFPLNNGFVLFTTAHPTWTGQSTARIHSPSRTHPFFPVGIQISTDPNPDSFDDFHTSNGSDQLAVPYYKGEGTQGCIPVSIGALNLPGAVDGSNVTLQIVQDGSDGSLYQVRQIFRFIFFPCLGSLFSYTV